MNILQSGFETVLEIRDPLRGYINVTDVEYRILNLRAIQRLRNIRASISNHVVYPSDDQSMMGHMLGSMYMTGVFFESISDNSEEIQKGRLATMLLSISSGPWANVMDEYLTTRGFDRISIAKRIIMDSIIGDKLSESSFSKKELVDIVEKGVQVKGYNLNLSSCTISPELIDTLERDAYFAGVEYAQLEFRKLFSATRIVKNTIAVERGSLFNVESYLSAGANMFEAVYYNKTVRASDLMLLRILDEQGSVLFPHPSNGLDAFLQFDDLDLRANLDAISADPPQDLKLISQVYLDHKKRYLIKAASERSIENAAFLSKIAQPDGLFNVENEIAEEADIDPKNVFVDFPDRLSVSYFPGKYPIDELMLFERGTRGYEIWPITEHSLVARSFKRTLKPIRVFTTRGYRSKVKKVADKYLESIDTQGQC
jgi:HD superfamily phosphohydrolase